MIGRIALAMEKEKELLARPNTVPRDSADLHTLASVIDHTMLRPEASQEEMGRFCREAVALGVGAVAMHPAWVPLAA